MRVVGGTFGSTGKAYISRDGSLVVEALKSGSYQPAMIDSINASKESSK